MDQALLERMCRLAELELFEGEKESVLQDLEKMVGCFEVISELDVEGVEPLYGVLELDEKMTMDCGENVLREDVVLDAPCPEELLANAPALQDGLIVVPKTFS
ncbi:MAG: Asp-tRNA(Asn)/Glu-tRNA(Gln) amidotransferase subunit GatC [Lachnospiraceae bacterium]|nr:Asp-tRNA(Asn)/Glu-tRNA(Gln) amidotransferase subunit GatC [Lachnospiraceae bacterium]